MRFASTWLTNHEHVDLPTDPRIIACLLRHATNQRQKKSHLLAVSIIDVRTNALQDLVFAFNCLVLMRIPVLLELAACLLVDFLLYVELSFVQYCDVVCQYSNFNLRPFCSIERWLPPLDE